MADDNIAEEKLYLVTYEHKLEPLYSKTTSFSIGTSPEDAERRLLDEDPQRDDLIVLKTKEFKIEGYNITLEKIIE